MFSNIDMEKYIEPEGSGFFFDQKWLPKIYCLGPRNPFYAYED